MLQTLTLYLVTVSVFLVADYFGLSYMMRPLFEKHIGGLLTESFRFVPALIFYMFYVVGILVFVSLPALRADAPLQALLMGAFLGALAYGTYEFSNYATLKDWHWQMVAVDLTWGTVLTGVSAWVGVVATRAIFA